MGKLWTPSEKMFLKEHYCGRGAEWCAEKLRRSNKAVRAAVVKLGLVRHPKKAQAQQRRRLARDAWRGRDGGAKNLLPAGVKSDAPLQGSALAQALGVTGRVAA